MMKIAVILMNAPDTELDRKVIEVPAEQSESEAIKEALDDWTLSVGDTIRIIELT